MNKDDLTVVKIRKGTLEIIRKFCNIHDWSFAQFCERLAITLTCGIDGLTEWEISELKKTYPYSDILICADVRNIIGFPESEHNEQ